MFHLIAHLIIHFIVVTTQNVDNEISIYSCDFHTDREGEWSKSESNIEFCCGFATLRDDSSIWSTIPTNGYKSIHIDMMIYAGDLQNDDKCSFYYQAPSCTTTDEWQLAYQASTEGWSNVTVNVPEDCENDAGFQIKLASESQSAATFENYCLFGHLKIYAAELSSNGLEGK